jgi:hypothetical protein
MTNIIPGLKPYLMDKDALFSKINCAVAFDDRYADKLAKLLDSGLYEEFRDVICFMLDKRVRLEQEAFLI